MTIDQDYKRLTELWGSVSKDTPFFTLGEIMLELSVINARLGEHVADLHLKATSAEGKQFLHHKSLNSSDTKAALLARYESVDARKEYERAKYVWKSTDVLANRIQSWLNIKKTELNNGGRVT